MTALNSVPPGLWLLAAGLLLALLRGRLRAAIVLGAPLLVLAVIWMLPADLHSPLSFLGYHLVPVQVTALGRLFATIFALMSFGTGLFALRQASTTELCAALAYAGTAIGVSLAGDLITVLLFWELMAVFSVIIIWSAATPTAYRAGMRYAGIHLLGGVLLMIGVIGQVQASGSTAFVAMQADSVYTALILAAFLINTGAPPLSAWIPDAYPEASPSGMVFLSAFTTKTAVYVLIRGFPGEEILVFVGLYMIFYGILYALLENDMRRILAYSIVNQVGFMVCGAGIGTAMALNGAAAHAFCHIIYKALLLMSAGSVLFMTGRRKCTELGGLYRSMRLTAACGIVGALSISAFPLTSGFISKSMISQAAADESLAIAWFLLAAASAGVFLHAGIKFPWFVFFQKDSGLRPRDPPANMRLAMLFFAFLCIGLGAYPQPLYAILPYPVDFVPYTASHVISQLQLLLFAGLAFFVLLPLLQRTNTISLDVDWLYRRLSPAAANSAVSLLLHVRRGGQVAVRIALGQAGAGWHRTIPAELRGRAWGVGLMAACVALLLGLYLALVYR